MKKVFLSVTALMLALGLTVPAQAQVGAEKSKPATTQVQKTTATETATEAAKTEVQKVAPAEAKKGDQPATGKKLSGIEAKKDQETATKDKTAKEVKTTAVSGKKTGQETKVDKQ
jgi:hypothetical protein